MKHFLNTLMFSIRMASKARTNTILCICILAGGIALATSSYKLYEMLFAVTVPYEHSDRMTVITRVSGNQDHQFRWPIESYKMFRERQSTYSDILTFVPEGLSLKYEAQSTFVQGMYVDPSFCRIIGKHPVIGREFTDEDRKPDSPSVGIISYSLWRSMFNCSPDILGKTIRSDGVVRTIVGVMPEGFDGPSPVSGVEMWVPLNPDTIKSDTGWVNFVMMLGVVKPGISRAEATLQTNAITLEIVKAYPQENENITGSYLRYLNDASVDGGGRRLLGAVFACAFLILLMSCGIVSGLLTARFSTRTQELAVRSALGASRAKLVGQMLVEFLAISCPAVILGFLLSMWFDASVLNSFYDQFGIPAYMRQHNSVKMVVFIVAVLCLVTLVSTIMPALRASRTDLNLILRESTRTGSSLRITRLSNFLITWQVATACVVMCGGAMVGYFIYTYQHFYRTFNPDDYVTARIAFNARDQSNRVAKCNEVNYILQRLVQNPNIEKACMTTEFFSGNQWNGSEEHVWVDGKDYVNDNDAPLAFDRLVTPGYMDAMNIPLLTGRDFTPQDDENRPVAIVTEGFAKQHYGSIDVVGKRFKLGRNDSFTTIVGVVPEVYNPTNDPAAHYGFFRPYAVQAWDDIFIIIKGRGSFEDLRKTVTATIESVDDKICFSQFVPFETARDQNGPATFLDFLLALFVTFSICALVMTAGGLYGIISFSTNIRRTEMGIRLALGAKPSGLVLLMTRRGLVFVAIGLVLGAVGTMGLRQVMLNEFAGSGDAAWTFPFVGIALIVISGVSIFIPAYRAARCEPSAALRD
jgi:predicted permease